MESIDTGSATAETPRASVFAGAMPASNAAVDFATKTNTDERQDVFNPDSSLTNPPSAPTGSA